MRNGNLLIDMHVHLARYEVLSDSTREWFISLYPSEAAYQAVCDANASPEDFCAMLAEKGVDYAVILAEDTPPSPAWRTTCGWRTSARDIPGCCPSAPSTR